MLNKYGERTQPCQTPVLTQNHSDSVFATLTISELFSVRFGQQVNCRGYPRSIIHNHPELIMGDRVIVVMSKVVIFTFTIVFTKVLRRLQFWMAEFCMTVRSTQLWAWQFLSTSILQRSVAAHLRGGGKFYCRLTTNLLLDLFWKNFENRSAFGKVRGKNIVAPLFPDTVKLNESVGCGVDSGAADAVVHRRRSALSHDSTTTGHV